MADAGMLAMIDRFWRARVAGDATAIQGLLAPAASYEMVGAKRFAGERLVGPGEASGAVEELIQQFTFHAVPEQLTVIADGRSAAIVSKFTVSLVGGDIHHTIACDIWEFDAAGRIKSLRQFVDTDLVRQMVGG